MKDNLNIISQDKVTQLLINQKKCLEVQELYLQKLDEGDEEIDNDLHLCLGLSKNLCHVEPLTSLHNSYFITSLENVKIICDIPLRLYVEGNDISKGETLHLVISNGVPKLEIVQRKYKQIV